MRRASSLLALNTVAKMELIEAVFTFKRDRAAQTTPLYCVRRHNSPLFAFIARLTCNDGLYVYVI